MEPTAMPRGYMVERNESTINHGEETASVRTDPTPEPWQRSKEQFHLQQVQEHLQLAKDRKLRCFACGGITCISQVKKHPRLCVHVCYPCFDMYHNGTFSKDDDGHEVFCRMCGNGGDILWCDEPSRDNKRKPCPYSFCMQCISRNFGPAEAARLDVDGASFTCWMCDGSAMEQLRRRIPGYVENSKRIVTGKICQRKKNFNRTKIEGLSQIKLEEEPPNNRVAEPGSQVRSMSVSGSSPSASPPKAKRSRLLSVTGARQPPPLTESAAASAAIAQSSIASLLASHGTALKGKGKVSAPLATERRKTSSSLDSNLKPNYKLDSKLKPVKREGGCERGTSPWERKLEDEEEEESEGSVGFYSDDLGGSNYDVDEGDDRVAALAAAAALAAGCKAFAKKKTSARKRNKHKTGKGLSCSNGISHDTLTDGAGAGEGAERNSGDRLSTLRLEGRGEAGSASYTTISGGVSYRSPSLSLTASASKLGRRRGPAPPPDGPGKGAILWPPISRRRGRRTSRDGGNPAGAGAVCDVAERYRDSPEEGRRRRARDAASFDRYAEPDRGFKVGGGSAAWSTSESEGVEQEDEELSTDSSGSDSNGNGGVGFGSGSGSGSGSRAGRGVGRRASGRPRFFEWDRKLGRVGGVIDDLSRGMEKNASIQVCNDVDSERLPGFRYVTSYVMGDGVQQKRDIDSMACCDCTDGCRDRDRCACLRLRAGDEGNNDTDAWPEGVASSGGDGRHARSPEEDEISQRFYGDNGLLLLERRAIFECHEKCSCNPTKCKNRVVSGGVNLRLQVFRCAEPEKGWGLRCLDRIPAGTFVACYLGEVLRDRDVDERGKQQGDDYVFSIDFAKQAHNQRISGASTETDNNNVIGGTCRGTSSPVLSRRGMSPVSTGRNLSSLLVPDEGAFPPPPLSKNAEPASPANPTRRSSGDERGLMCADIDLANGTADGGRRGSVLNDITVDTSRGGGDSLGSLDEDGFRFSPGERGQKQGLLSMLCSMPAASSEEGVADEEEAKPGAAAAPPPPSTPLHSPVRGPTSDENDLGNNDAISCDSAAERHARGVLSPKGEVVLKDFIQTTGCQERAHALFFLRGADEDLGVALNHYFDFDHSKGIPCAQENDGNNVRETEVLHGANAVPGRDGADSKVEGREDGRASGDRGASSRDARSIPDHIGGDARGTLEGERENITSKAAAIDHIAGDTPRNFSGHERDASRGESDLCHQEQSGSARRPHPGTGAGISLREIHGRSLDGFPRGLQATDVDGDDTAAVAAEAAAAAAAAAPAFSGAPFMDVGSRTSSRSDPSHSADREPSLLPTSRNTHSSLNPRMKDQVPNLGNPKSSPCPPGVPKAGRNVAARSTSGIAGAGAAMPSSPQSPIAVLAQELDSCTRNSPAKSPIPDPLSGLSIPRDVSSPKRPSSALGGLESMFDATGGERKSRGVYPRARVEASPTNLVPAPQHYLFSQAQSASQSHENASACPTTPKPTPTPTPSESEQVSLTHNTMRPTSNTLGSERSGCASDEATKGPSWHGAGYSPHSRAPAEALVVDAKAYGNVARFMNHSCDGNLTKHMVFAESHDSRMPRVAFFAPEIIEPMQELTYDYGYVVGAVEGENVTCRCGASCCRGRLL